MFAVIETLGRQYKVTVGDQIKVDRISLDHKDADLGSAITFDRVLLVGGGEQVRVGTPILSGVTVAGKIVEQGKEKKGVALRKNVERATLEKLVFEELSRLSRFKRLRGK